MVEPDKLLPSEAVQPASAAADASPFLWFRPRRLPRDEYRERRLAMSTLEQTGRISTLLANVAQMRTGGRQVKPLDWLLMLLALRDAEQPLDPVRLQKGLFLLAHEGGVSDAEAYSFEPYDYGPFSSEIYRDLDLLMTEGKVREVDVPGFNWKRYAITGPGVEQAQAILSQLDPDRRQVLRRLASIKAELLELKFDALLRRVYDRYPEYAANSVFRA
jgi:uncharacterized protein YwgA